MRTKILKVILICLLATTLLAGLLACGKNKQQNGKGTGTDGGQQTAQSPIITDSVADDATSQGTLENALQTDSAAYLPECTSVMDVSCQASGIAAMPDGSMLVTDVYNKVVWKVQPHNGISTVYAGGETVQDPYGEPIGGYNDSVQKKSFFATPWAVAPFLGGYAVSDAENNAIRLILDGQVQTINGRTNEKLKVGKLGVVFDHPTGLAADQEGNLYVADTHNGAVRKISPKGLVTTVVTGLKEPTGLCWKDGALYIAETGGNRVLVYANGKCKILAGCGEDDFIEGASEEAAFAFPQGVAVGDDGTVYVADTGNSAVRMIKDGEVTTLLCRDRTSLEMDLVSPVGLMIQGDDLYICDSFTRKVLKVPAKAGGMADTKTEAGSGTGTKTTRESAATINLSRTEGDVTVTNAADKEIKIIKNMRLSDGYQLATEKKSYAWAELDKSKLVKVDAVSEVEIREKGKVLELLVNSGNAFFNVTEPLKSDETLNICTSSMIAGVRGTCGWVKILTTNCTRIYLLEGKLECAVIDPVTGEMKTDYIKGGEWADFIVFDQEKKGDKCLISRGSFTKEEVPGFVLVELVGDAKRCEEIFLDSGIDLRDMTLAEAQERLAEDEEQLEEILEKIEEALAGQDNNVSVDPVWEEEGPAPKTPADDKKKENNDSGNGGSPGGGSNENKTDSNKDKTNKNKTENVDITKNPDDVEDLLDDGKDVTVKGDDTSNIYRVDSDLHIPEGTTLTIKDGLTLAVGAAATVTVDGTLKANGDVENNGKIVVNSNKSVHVKGAFTNYGDVVNQNKGKIDAAQGIDNYGSVHCAGKSTLYSSSGEGTVRMRGGASRLTVAGGDITNKKGGAALALEEASQIDGVTFTEETLLQSVTENVVTVAGQKLKVKDYTTSFNQSLDLFQFMIDKKTVTFVGGEGSETKQVSTLAGFSIGKAIPKLARAGYELTGFNTAADGTGSEFTKDTKVNEDMTVYAQWKANPVTFTVTFDANGGTLISDKTVTVAYNGTVELPMLKAPTGYVLFGWYTAKDSKGVKVTGEEPITANVTYYARWVPGETQKYKVIFDIDKGTWPEVTDAVIEVVLGEKVTQPKEPSRTGYIFGGWYALNESGAPEAEKYNFDAPVTKAFTLRALWNPTECKVKFVVNTLPDMISDDVKNKPEDQVVYFDSVVTEPQSEPEYENFSFDGWYADETLTTKYDFETLVKGDVTLYAKWAKMLVVRYMLDSGKPVNDAAKETLKKAGYFFEEIKEGDVVKDTALVQYVKNGGTATAPSKELSDLLTRTETKYEDWTIDYMGVVSAPVERQDKSIQSLFYGWYADTDLNKAFDFEKTTVTEEIKIYAGWERQVYSDSTPVFAVFGGAYGSVCGRDYTVVDGLNINTKMPLHVRNIDKDTTVNTTIGITDGGTGSGADITFARININVPESWESDTVTCYSDATIRFEGKNTIKNDCKCNAITAKGAINLIGEDDATLTLKPQAGQGSAISAGTNVNIDKMKLTADGGIIYTGEGNVTISDSEVSARGIKANGVTNGGDVKGTIEISGEKTEVNVTNPDEKALYAQTGIKVSGGEVTACTTAASTDNFYYVAAIDTLGYVNVSGGKLSAVGVDRGIYSYYINVTGGELVANVTDMVDMADVANMNDHTAYAVFVERDFHVSGGKVTISEKDAAKVPYYGVYADVDANINISGGSVYMDAIIGIEMTREIAISQTGKLDVDFYEFGVECFRNMTVTGGVSNFTCRNDAKNPTAIYGENLSIEGGTVNANVEDSTRTGTGVMLRNPFGEMPVLKVTGGTLNAKGAGGEESYGIDLDYNNGKATLLVEGGTVNAINEKGGGGLRAYRTTLNGGTVKVQGGTSNQVLLEVQSAGALDSDSITNIDGAGVVAQSGATFDMDRTDIETGWVLDANKLYLYDDNGAVNSMYTEYSANIQTVYVGDDVNEIAPNYFNECVNLTNFEVGANNETFYGSRIDNDYTMYALMSEDPTTSKKTLVRFPTGGPYIIHSYFSDVNIIGPYAFAGCEALIDETLRWSSSFSLTAMSNLEAIDETAFDGWSTRLNQILITYNDNLNGVVLPGMEISSYPSMGHGNNGTVYWSIQYSADERGYGWGLSVYTAANSTEKRDLGSTFINDWGRASYIELVERIVVKDGIKAVSALAFPEYTKLKKVYLPDGLENIHKGNLDRFAAKNADIVWNNKTYSAGTELNGFMDDFLEDESSMISEYVSGGYGDWNDNTGYYGIKNVKSGSQLLRTFYAYTRNSKGYLPFGPYENDICSSTLEEREPDSINRLEIGNNIEVISAGAFPELINLKEVALSDAVNAIHTDILDNVFFKQSGTVVKWKGTDYTDKDAFKQAFVGAGNDILIATSGLPYDYLKCRVGKGIYDGAEIYNFYFYATSKESPQSLRYGNSYRVVNTYNSNNIWIYIGDNISGINKDAFPADTKIVGVTIPLGTKTIYKATLDIFFADRSADNIVTKVQWNGKEYTRDNRSEFEEDFKNYIQEDGTSNEIPES